MAIFFPATTLWVVVGLVISLPTSLFLMIYFWWAPNNLFFTFVKEGTAKIVARGDSFEKILIQWMDYEVAKKATPVVSKWDVIKGPSGKKFFGGLRFYGLWPLWDIFIYAFSWTNFAQSGDKAGQPVAHDKVLLDFVLLKTDVYWARVEKAEDKNLLPLSVGIILTIRIINPHKALFAVQNWLETVINRIQPAVRQIITTKSFEKWIVEKADLARIIFLALQGKDGNGNFDPTLTDLISEFRSLYGVDIQAFAVQEINPPEEQRQATLKKYLADQEAKGVVVSARAEAKKIIHLAEAERRRLETVFGQIQKFGDLGPALRALEAMERSQNWVVSAPELAGILRRALGTRPSGSP